MDDDIEEQDQPVELLGPADLTSCGTAGKWMPDCCPVHLPDRIKRELDI